LDGITVSLRISFNASLNGCRIPYQPTVFGPILRWKAANAFLSIIVIKATEIKIGNNTLNTSTNPRSISEIFDIKYYLSFF